jgi:hypothetical protein
LVDDAVLPAAAHLTGPQSRHVLRAALDAVGGDLERVRPCHVHYRPGYDVVIRFDSIVRWASGAPVNETLVAATTVDGPPAGTLPVEAVTDDGVTLSVGVWRWPFDPVLVGLADAVTPSKAGAFLGGLCRGRPTLEVVTYRPTQRAVVRATDEDGTEFYVKAVRPREVTSLVERHRSLLDAGLPVPAILRHDVDRGLVAMAALTGLTVRERIKRGQRCLPGAEQYETVYRRLADVQLPGARPVAPRTKGGLHHAAMLARVLPSEATRLHRLSDRLAPAAERAAERSGPTVHGDLYEGQLVTGHGRAGAATITGLLDLDDAGSGDPLDDRATVIAHLLDRVVDGPFTNRQHLVEYLGGLRSAFAEQVDPVELDLVIAGSLIGLATGPFRVQRPRWKQAARRRLALADRLAARPGRRELRLGTR